MGSSERLASLSTEKLLDVVKNHRQYAYGPEVRDQALDLLRARGYELEELRSFGVLENQAYDRIEDLAGAFRRDSTIVFIAYLGLLCSVLVGVVARNTGLETLAMASLIARIAASLVCMVFVIRAFLDQDAFYKAIRRPEDAESPAGYFLLGMPLYFIMYFQFRKKMNEALRTVR